MLINKFIDEIKPKIKNLNKLEIARFVYIELGKTKVFNDEFLFGTGMQRSKIYNNEKDKEKLSINDLMSSNKVICIGISKLYQEILMRLNINCKLCSVGEEECKHIFNVIEPEDGQQYKADLQKDMRYIQTGMRTHYFGTANMEDLDTIPSEQLNNIDKKIGYIEEDYADTYLTSLIKKRENENVIEAVTRVLQDEKFNKIMSKIGYVEAISLTKNLMSSYTDYSCFPPKSAVNVLYCYDSENKITNSPDSICIFVKDIYPNEACFLFKRRTNQFIQISNEEIARLKKLGVKLVNSDQYKNHRIKNEIKNRQNSIAVTSSSQSEQEAVGDR